LFIKAVTSLADKREVVAREDIYAKGGMKLVSGGSRLSGHHYDRLVAHKLLKPIEQSLCVAGALDANRLLSLVLEKARLIPSLVQRLDQPELLERLSLSPVGRADRNSIALFGGGRSRGFTVLEVWRR